MTVLTARLDFHLPENLFAARPPEARGLARDQVQLLVLDAGRRSWQHARFTDLPAFLRPGDLLVVNASQAIAASLPARHGSGPHTGLPFRIHLSTPLPPWEAQTHGLPSREAWIVEPRTARGIPGEPIAPGEEVDIPGPKGGALARVRFVAPYRSFARLWVAGAGAQEALLEVAARVGEPIRYPYLEGRYPIRTYQTVYGDVPGSAEMPSAGRPFSRRTLQRLRAQGVEVARIVLHTGVSSHEIETPLVDEQPTYPEPFEVPPATAAAVNSARQRGGRVIAVGTTVVRALESCAGADSSVRPARGFTDLFVSPARPVRSVDGLLTGLHAPRSSHLAMLSALVDPELLLASYEDAKGRGYLWHEFGDSNLILR